MKRISDRLGWPWRIEQWRGYRGQRSEIIHYPGGGCATARLEWTSADGEIICQFKDLICSWGWFMSWFGSCCAQRGWHERFHWRGWWGNVFIQYSPFSEWRVCVKIERILNGGCLFSSNGELERSRWFLSTYIKFDFRFSYQTKHLLFENSIFFVELFIDSYFWFSSISITVIIHVSMNLNIRKFII